VGRLFFNPKSTLVDQRKTNVYYSINTCLPLFNNQSDPTAAPNGAAQGRAQFLVGGAKQQPGVSAAANASGTLRGETGRIDGRETPGTRPGGFGQRCGSALTEAHPVGNPTMNKDRRKQLDALRQRIETLKSEAESLKDDLESGPLSDEQDAFDNMPESLQDGEKGTKAQEALDSMQEAIDALDEVCNALDEATQALEKAAE
jgi:hypothetical protein